MTSILKHLEAEAIEIFREVVANSQNPVMLYSVGKDSSVMLRLALKAFAPGPLPFPLMHIDTGYKFPEMYSFRDKMAQQYQFRLIVESNKVAQEAGAHPSHLGQDLCCQQLKTQALLDALNKHGFDSAFGGARREEEKSRAKERIISIRDTFGQWNPKLQRPELWNMYNCQLSSQQSLRAFPLSNWTELNIWEYIRDEEIAVVPLYFAQKRAVVEKGTQLLPMQGQNESEPVQEISIRYRSLGCMPCSGGVRSEAQSIEAIIAELKLATHSERENRLIDLTSEASMETKKREGYF